MPWQLLSTIEVSSSWKLTEPVVGSIFRITHISATGSNQESFRGVIAQAFKDNDARTFFDFQRLAYKAEVEGLVFNEVQGLVERRLAVKRIDSLTSSWSVKIEVLNGKILKPILSTQLNYSIASLSVGIL